MAKKFGSLFRYDNKLDMIKVVLNIHFALEPPKERMYERSKEALAYYIVYGYNKETVEDIETMLTEDVKKGYVRTINTHLRTNGYLVKDKNNKHKSYLSEDMLKYRKEFVLDKGSMFTVGFLKK